MRLQSLRGGVGPVQLVDCYPRSESMLKNREKQKRHLAECRSEGSEFSGRVSSITGSGDLGWKFIWRLGGSAWDWDACGAGDMGVLFRVGEGQPCAWEPGELLG